MINHSRKKVYILDKDVGILHANNTRALELAALQVKVQLAATLGLTLIGPINRLTAFCAKGNRDNGTFAKGLRLETVNDIVNLGLHLCMSNCVRVKSAERRHERIEKLSTTRCSLDLLLD